MIIVTTLQTESDVPIINTSSPTTSPLRVVDTIIITLCVSCMFVYHIYACVYKVLAVYVSVCYTLCVSDPEERAGRGTSELQDRQSPERHRRGRSSCELLLRTVPQLSTEWAETYSNS